MSDASFSINMGANGVMRVNWQGGTVEKKVMKLTDDKLEKTRKALANEIRKNAPMNRAPDAEKHRAKQKRKTLKKRVTQGRARHSTAHFVRVGFPSYFVEKGHEKVIYGHRTDGFVPGYPFIEPAFERALKQLVSEMEGAV